MCIKDTLLFDIQFRILLNNHVVNWYISCLVLLKYFCTNISTIQMIETNWPSEIYINRLFITHDAIYNSH